MTSHDVPQVDVKIVRQLDWWKIGQPAYIGHPPNVVILQQYNHYLRYNNIDNQVNYTSIPHN